MNFDLGHIDPQLRDWLIAFAICMVAMFWTRLFGPKEQAADADAPQEAGSTSTSVEDRR